MQITAYFENEVKPFSKEKYRDCLLEFIYTHNPKLPHTPLLLTAFTHKSFTHEIMNNEFESYERLEFLGDSVLQLLVSNTLYQIFPNLNEGVLSKMRSALVNEQKLAAFFKLLGYEKYILLGRGEHLVSGHEKSSIQANVFESLLGAIYVSEGLQSATAFFSNVVKLYEQVNEERLFSEELLVTFDAKTRLQELVMKKYQVLPNYLIDEINGEFEIKLLINGKKINELRCHSKKKGMQQLAKETLKQNLI